MYVYGDKIFFNLKIIFKILNYGCVWRDKNGVIMLEINDVFILMWWYFFSDGCE